MGTDRRPPLPEDVALMRASREEFERLHRPERRGGYLAGLEQQMRGAYDAEAAHAARGGRDPGEMDPVSGRRPGRFAERLAASMKPSGRNVSEGRPQRDVVAERLRAQHLAAGAAEAAKRGRAVEGFAGAIVERWGVAEQEHAAGRARVSGVDAGEPTWVRAYKKNRAKEREVARRAEFDAAAEASYQRRLAERDDDYGVDDEYDEFDDDGWDGQDAA